MPALLRISLQFTKRSLARIDAVGVPTTPNASDSNGRRLGQGVGTVKFVPALPLQSQSQQNPQKGWDKTDRGVPALCPTSDSAPALASTPGWDTFLPSPRASIAL